MPELIEAGRLYIALPPLYKISSKTKGSKYAWDEKIPDGSEPELWFHEIFRKDGSPYKKEEVDCY
jgi:DNA gyrase/topoisomerase IV subunit B